MNWNKLLLNRIKIKCGKCDKNKMGRIRIKIQNNKLGSNGIEWENGIKWVKLG